MPKIAIEKYRALPRLTAPMASAPSRPTNSVSTIPMAIQPSSARITGPARDSIGLSSVRIPCLTHCVVAHPHADRGQGGASSTPNKIARRSRNCYFVDTWDAIEAQPKWRTDPRHAIFL